MHSVASSATVWSRRFAPRQSKKSTSPVWMLYIAPTILTAPEASRSASVALRRWRHRQLDVLARHRVDKAVVLRRAFSLICGRLHGRPDLGEQPSEVPKLFRVAPWSVPQRTRGDRTS